MDFQSGVFCREYTDASSGTAVLLLQGVTSENYNTFLAGVGDGNITDYRIADGSGWINCRGVYTSSPPTLTRSRILSSSSGGGDVTFVGTSQVYGIASPVFLNTRNTGIFIARDYGALPNSGADESAHIQAAINAAAAAGGGTVQFEVGDYKVATGLLIQNSGVMLAGIKCRDWYFGTSAGTAPASGTRLLYTGTGGAGTYVVGFQTPSGASNTICCLGGLRDIDIDGNGLADSGLFIKSWLAGRAERITVQGGVTYDVYITAYPFGALAGHSDTQDWVFEQFSLTATGSTYAMFWDGDNGANTSYNTFRRGRIFHENGNGLTSQDGDNNTVQDIRIWNPSGGTGFSLAVAGTGGSAAPYAYRTNDSLFFRGYCQAKLWFGGSETGYANKALGVNLILDASNGSATPTSSGSFVGTGTNAIIWRLTDQPTFTST